ncbi:MAG: XdhC family protein [Longimicrobiales bacterium]
MNIDGIVLAAGRSTRMGSSKAQLTAEPGQTFLERTVHLLRAAGCRYVVAVVNKTEDWTARLADVAGAAVVINDVPGSHQIDSIRLGLAWLPDDADAAVILPVDFPAIQMETVRMLMHAFRESQPGLLLPTHEGRAGHPVIVARSLFGEFLAEPLPQGAETVVLSHPDRVQVAVTDAGVLMDIDTPAEYQRWTSGKGNETKNEKGLANQGRLDALGAAVVLLDARRFGQAVASVKSLAGESAGAHVIVFADGSTRGSLGSSQLDSAAHELGRACLHSGQPAMRELDPGVRLFGEPQLTQDRLVIVGAGHIAVPLAQIGASIGFAVTVLDDREEFATEARFPAECRVMRMNFSNPFADVPLDARTYVVLVTRAHVYDFDCLRHALMQEYQPRYIGMIGSRRRVRAAFHALTEAGVPVEKLAGVRAPVGLDIGAETPAEIAVSIAAELIRERAGTGTYTPLAAGERVLERFFATREHDG